MSVYSEDFASGVLPSGPEWAYVTTSAPDVSTLITVQTTASLGGFAPSTGAVNCVQIKTTDSNSSTASLTLDFDVAGSITFQDRCSSEEGFDYARFFIDGVLQLEQGGNNGWQPRGSYPVGVGTHTFAWRYVKDSSDFIGFDAYGVTSIVATGVAAATPPPTPPTYRVPLGPLAIVDAYNPPTASSQTYTIPSAIVGGDGALSDGSDATYVDLGQSIDDQYNYQADGLYSGNCPQITDIPDPTLVTDITATIRYKYVNPLDGASYMFIQGNMVNPAFPTAGVDGYLTFTRYDVLSTRYESSAVPVTHSTVSLRDTLIAAGLSPLAAAAHIQNMVNSMRAGDWEFVLYVVDGATAPGSPGVNDVTPRFYDVDLSLVGVEGGGGGGAPPTVRVRQNALRGTLGASLDAVATSATFAAPLTHSNGTALATLADGEYVPLTLLDANGLTEIVWLTAYTSAATTGTILRAQEGTPAVTHANGDRFVNAITVADLPA